MTTGLRPPGAAILASARRAGLFTVTVAIAALALCVLPSLVGGPRPVLVTSGSMAPAVRAGDVVLVSEPEGPVAPGSIVTFRADDGPGLVTHRVVSVEADGRYRTRGDANPTDDSTPVPASRVEGAAVYVVPFVGRPAVWWVERSWGPLAVTFAIVVGAAVALLLRPSRRVDPNRSPFPAPVAGP